MQNERKYKLILDQIQESYGLHRMIFDEDGQAVDFTFLEVNKKFEEMTGYSFEDIEDKTILEVAPETDLGLIKSYAQVLETGDPFYGTVYADGADKTFQVSAYKYDEETFSTLFMDITGQEKIKKDLFHSKEIAEATSKAKSNFLSNLSHEVRTPLNGIIGLSHISKKEIRDKKGKLDQAKLTSNLEHIQKLSRDLLKVINDTLEYSDLELGRVNLEESPVKIERILAEAVQYYRLEARGKNINIISRLDEGLTDNYLGDEAKLLKVLYYLLGNGVRNTPYGTVEISVKESVDGALMVKVTGVGYQAGGLDLDIASAFVEQMGGRLVFETANEEIGLAGVSRVRLPLKRLPQEREAVRVFDNQLDDSCQRENPFPIRLAEKIEEFSEDIHKNVFIGEDAIEETLSLLDTCPEFKEEFMGVTRSLDIFDYPEAQDKIRNLLKRMKADE